MSLSIIVMGKQQSVRWAQQELAKPDTYLFKDIQLKLTKDNLNKDHELIKTIDILLTETIGSCIEKKLKVGGKWQRKLKVMSILTCFHGCTGHTLPLLERQIGTKREETLDLLLEASINKLVSVQIDEESGRIRILKSKVREREMSGDEADRYMRGKLIQIKDKNTRLERELTGILTLVGGKEQLKQHKKEPRRGGGEPWFYSNS